MCNGMLENVRDLFGSTVAWLGPLIRADDRSARCKLCDITLFHPTFSEFDSHMYGWTPVLSLLLIPAVYRCRYAMQRYVYATPFLEMGREYAAHLHTLQISSFLDTPQKMTFSSCYNKWSVGYFGLKLYKHILGTPKTNITSSKKGYNWWPLISVTLFYSKLIIQ